MKKSLPWLMLLGVSLLVGCASKKDANEKNFSEALNSYLAKKGQLCLGIPSAWPVDLNEAERRGGMGTAAEMAALEKAGLVRSHETETEYTPPLSARPVKAGGLPKTTVLFSMFLLKQNNLVMILACGCLYANVAICLWGGHKSWHNRDGALAQVRHCVTPEPRHHARVRGFQELDSETRTRDLCRDG